MPKAQTTRRFRGVVVGTPTLQGNVLYMENRCNTLGTLFPAQSAAAGDCGQTVTCSLSAVRYASFHTQPISRGHNMAHMYTLSAT